MEFCKQKPRDIFSRPVPCFQNDLVLSTRSTVQRSVEIPSRINSKLANRGTRKLSVSLDRVKSAAAFRFTDLTESIRLNLEAQFTLEFHNACLTLRSLTPTAGNAT